MYCAAGEVARQRWCRQNVVMNNGKKTGAIERHDVIAVQSAEEVRVDVVVRDETQPVQIRRS